MKQSREHPGWQAMDLGFSLKCSMILNTTHDKHILLPYRVAVMIKKDSVCMTPSMGPGRSQMFTGVCFVTVHWSESCFL